MTRRTRQRVFYVLLALFFVVSGSVVLYAEGWRVDLLSWPWRPEKVGGIFVRSYPADASITLNGKPVQNQSGIFSGIFGPGTVISDLFPRNYSLTLSARGYAPWQENVAVLPSLVAQLKYAVLVPQASTKVMTSTATLAKDFSLVGGEPVLETHAGAEIWNGRNIGEGAVVAESADLTEAVIKDFSDSYYLYHFSTGSTTALSPLFTASGIITANIKTIEVNPSDATEIAILTPARVRLLHTTTDAIVTAGTATHGTVLASPLAASASAIAWTEIPANANGVAEKTGPSTVVVYDRFSGTSTSSTTTLPGQTISLQWAKPGLLVVLQNDGSLYLYDTNAQTFQKLADTVQYVSPASDGSLVAALERMSLEIFSFTNTQTYHRFNIPDIANARGISWYGDMDHVFINFTDHVSFLDLDDLGLRNFIHIADLAPGTSPQYDAASNALYLIDPSHTLVRFDFPSY